MTTPSSPEGSSPDRQKYTPPLIYSLPERSIRRPRRITLPSIWLFGPTHYDRLRMGHEAKGQNELDTWNCYLNFPTDVFHVHDAPTGYERYRMDLLSNDDVAYVVRSLIVETDPVRYEGMTRQAEDAVVIGVFAALLANVMHVSPIQPM